MSALAALAEAAVFERSRNPGRPVERTPSLVDPSLVGQTVGSVGCDLVEDDYGYAPPIYYTAHPQSPQSHLYSPDDVYPADPATGPTPDPPPVTGKRRRTTSHRAPQKLPPPPPPPAKVSTSDPCLGCGELVPDDEPDALICHACRYAAHKECFVDAFPAVNLEIQLDRVRANTWTCLNCRKCDGCLQDTRAIVVLCDTCDIGYHMKCMNPPIRRQPAKWICEACAGPAVSEQDDTNHPTPAIRDASVASSSRAPPPTAPKKRGRPFLSKNKPKLAEALDIDVSATPKPRLRPSPKKSTRVQAEPPTSSPRQGRRTPRRPDTSPRSTRAPRVSLRSAANDKGKGKEEDEEEPLSFEALFSVREADSMKTRPAPVDRDKFQDSLTRAEKRLIIVPPPQTDVDDSAPGPSSRPLRSSFAQPSVLVPVPEASEPASTPPVESQLSKCLRIQTIHIGHYELGTWYDAPYPEEYTNPERKMWICEFCLKYMKSNFEFVRHRTKCKASHPPGDEIYRDGDVSLFEVDGRKNKIYCQNLCLLSKMFLDHKSLFYDVEPFLFYVVCTADEDGSHFVGYFSKEKMSPKNYNLSCIMTLPSFQRSGWGNFLMDFSYLLSKKEDRLGSPEKPLSALGKLGYHHYWKRSIMRFLEKAPLDPRLEDISAATAMTVEDVYTTLVELEMVEVIEAPAARPSPGQALRKSRSKQSSRRLSRHASEKKKKLGPAPDPEKEVPFEPPVRYAVRWDAKVVDEALGHWESKGAIKVKPEKLRWSPYMMPSVEKVVKEETRKGEGQMAGAVLVEEPEPESAALSLFDDEAQASPSLDVEAEQGDGRHASSTRERNSITVTVADRDIIVNGHSSTPAGSGRSLRRDRHNTSQTTPTPIPKRASTRRIMQVHQADRELTLVGVGADVGGELDHHDHDQDQPAETPVFAQTFAKVYTSAHAMKRKRKAGGGGEVSRSGSAVNGKGGKRRRVEERERVEDDVSMKSEEAGTPSWGERESNRQSVPSDDTLLGHGPSKYKVQALESEEEEDADGDYESDVGRS